MFGLRGSQPHRFLLKLQMRPERAVTKTAKALMCSGVKGMAGSSQGDKLNVS